MRTFGEDNFLRAASASSARLSCTYPKMPLSKTIAVIAIASLGNACLEMAIPAETMATPININNMMLVNWSIKMLSLPRPDLVSISLGP
jgi:hypothetical protein